MASNGEMRPQNQAVEPVHSFVRRYRRGSIARCSPLYRERADAWNSTSDLDLVIVITILRRELESLRSQLPVYSRRTCPLRTLSLLPAI